MAIGPSATLAVGMIVYQRNGAATDPGALTAWTLNGVAFTGLLESGVNVANRVALGWWVNPAGGTPVLTAAWPNLADAYMGLATFTGADNVNPVILADNVTGLAGTTVTINADAFGATIAVWGTNGSTPTVNFVKVFAQAPLGPGGGSTLQLGGSPTNAHTFTGAGGTQPTFAGIHLRTASTEVGGGLQEHRKFYPCKATSAIGQWGRGAQWRTTAVSRPQSRRSPGGLVLPSPEQIGWINSRSTSRNSACAR